MTKQTKIYFLEGVPLDPSYKNSIYFLTQEAQAEYFLGKAKFSMLDCTFQRQEQRIRVNRSVSDCYHINYLMWQNTSYSSKWFYAFVTRVEYINDGCTWMHFHVDSLQTYHFNYRLGYCWVERMHSLTDGLFENLVPENLETGDYVTIDRYITDYSNMSVCIMTGETSTGGKPSGKFYNKIYSPLNIMTQPVTADATQLNALLESYVGAGKENAIVAMYEYPSVLGASSEPDTLDLLLPVMNMPDNFDGYKPHNKKLFQYPYTQLVATNKSGQVVKYRWEEWGLAGAQFEVQGTFISSPAMICYPVNHAGIEKDYDRGLTLTSFPVNAWAGDTYKAYLAQNKAAILKNIVSGVAGGIHGGIAGGLPGAAIGAAVGAGTSIAGQMAQQYDIDSHPDPVYGSAQTDSLNTAIDNVGFAFYFKTIRAQFAQRIDAYFDRFGYAVNRFMEPVRNARKVYTYLKCSEVNLLPTSAGNLGIPEPNQDEIRNAYLSGVTWWKSGDQVGHYELDNTVGGN